ncbi:MAG: DUF4136 domain-containing protein [Candidatus Omnitrophica bacterium]|nr:DUF4136 domain-containing protein [Candidatus Omnitrophota bacterium]
MPENSADFLMTYHNVLQQKMSFQTIGNYGWTEPYYFQPQTYSYYYTEGTLIIDIIDRQSEKLVWRGTSVRVVSESTPEALDRKINEAVSQLLEKFPPPTPTRKEIKIEQTAKKVGWLLFLKSRRECRNNVGFYFLNINFFLGSGLKSNRQSTPRHFPGIFFNSRIGNRHRCRGNRNEILLAFHKLHVAAFFMITNHIRLNIHFGNF